LNTNTPNFLLRDATVFDIEAIQRIRQSVHENKLTTTEISTDDVQQAIENTGKGWVIEVNGEIIAFAIGNSYTGNIWALFVDPDHEGQGYGTQLLQAMSNWLWDQGLDKLWLTTETDTRAEKFYTQAGWSKTGRPENGEIKFELYKTKNSK